MVHCYIKGGVEMEMTKDVIICPDCGKEMDGKSMIQECDHCLSKKQD